MSDAPLAASVAATDMVQVMQPGGIVLATVGQVVAGPSAAIAALTAVVQSQAQQIAALQGRPDPNQAFAASLPVATLQIGSFDVSVPVSGLLHTDAVSVTVLADLPAGLALGAMHPHPQTDGVLIVQATASLSLAGASPIPLRVTALR